MDAQDHDGRVNDESDREAVTGLLLFVQRSENGRSSSQRPARYVPMDASKRLAIPDNAGNRSFSYVWDSKLYSSTIILHTLEGQVESWGSVSDKVEKACFRLSSLEAP